VPSSTWLGLGLGLGVGFGFGFGLGLGSGLADPNPNPNPNPNHLEVGRDGVRAGGEQQGERVLVEKHEAREAPGWQRGQG